MLGAHRADAPSDSRVARRSAGAVQPLRPHPVELSVSGAPVTSGRARLLGGALAAATVLWMLAWLGETVVAIVAIWSKSDTFAHGFLIVPISAWLIWRRRHVVAALEQRPGLVALPLLALAGFGWMFAGLAGVGVVQQFALVLMIPLIVWAVLGIQVLKGLAFPLFFLLFAVPVGQSLEGILMEHTADFTVAALRLTGIPVYREGQFFTIPSGSWSVVEACSGLRYLIASVTVGVLYAYLTYRSLARRLAFVAASIVVPVIANWLRAYMVVMIGHLSGMKYAVGVDHLIYGWLFFGVVMLLLFCIGSYWRDDLDPDVSGAAPAAPGNAGSRLPAMAGSALVAALVVAIWPVSADSLDRARYQGTPMVGAPPASGGWEPVAGSLAAWTPHFQDARALVSQTYAKGAARAAIQLRYYRNQRPGSQLISSQNLVIARDSVRWKAVGNRRSVFGNEEVPVIETRLAGVSGNLLVWRWYWVDGRYVANPYWAKLLQARSTLLGSGDDGAAVFLYAPYESNPDAARQTLRELAGSMLPAITKSLEHARQAGNVQ